LGKVAELAGKGKPAEKLVLIGDLKVVSARPPSSVGLAPGAILRPVDPALSGTMRVVATMAAGAALPIEGRTVHWSENDGYVIREVERGGDGQINVTVAAEHR